MWKKAIFKKAAAQSSEFISISNKQVDKVVTCAKNSREACCSRCVLSPNSILTFEFQTTHSYIDELAHAIRL